MAVFWFTASPVAQLETCSPRLVSSSTTYSRTNLMDTTVPRERRPFPAADVLRAVSFEALVAGIILGRLGAGHALTEDDRQRAFLACERLIAAADLALPPRDRRLAHREARRIADTSPEEAAA